MSNAFVKARRLARLTRFTSSVTWGTVMIEATYLAPLVADMRVQHLPDFRWFRFWTRELGACLNMEFHLYGEVTKEPALFVSNHISWMDVVTVSIATPLSFIAKNDIKTWPWAGNFTRKMKTVYIDRSNKFQAYRSIPNIEERLKEGRSVLVFPEGTTSRGERVLPFRPMFYEAAVRTGTLVQPMAIKYTDAEGNPLPEVSYADEDGFFETLNRTLDLDKVHAHITLLEPLDSTKLNRKEMAQKSEREIRKCLLESVRPPFN